MCALEPYYGGSHKIFLDGLIHHLPFHWDLLHLPARAWKWRMRLAAPYFAEQLTSHAPADAVFCSSFVDLACLRGLGPRWLADCPVTMYFHENQFAYPVQVEDQRDLHFAVTNLTSALAADRLAFNSSFNRDSFFEGAHTLLQKTPDMRCRVGLNTLHAKTEILPPGLDFSDIDRASPMPDLASGPPIILWNHRWEHDKGPERFFQILHILAATKVPFRLVVLGQSFRQRPPIFDQARKTLADHILHFGHSERDEYCRWLKSADIVVSTASHEFFGMAVIEAVRAGCRPFLPERLSYPELFDHQFLYQETTAIESLQHALIRGRIGEEYGRQLTERFRWEKLRQRYQHFLTDNHDPAMIE